MDTSSWQTVAVALIAALPGIIGAWRCSGQIRKIKKRLDGGEPRARGRTPDRERDPARKLGRDPAATRDWHVPKSGSVKNHTDHGL